MADDTRHAAVVESLKATASELHARAHEDMNNDWADRMADALAAAGLLAAPADEAGQWVKQIDNPKELPGLLLRMADLLDALESLPASLRRCADVARIQANASPAAPAAINVTVDREANAAYVRVAEGVVFRTAEINSSVNADYDRSAQLLGVEILGLPMAPAAPADDEAAVERMRRAIHDELCACYGGVGPCPHSSVELNAAARASLAALREGQ